VDNLSYSRLFWERFGGVNGDPKRFWRHFYETRLVPIFGQITGAQRILVVGCGLGLMVESVRDTGFASIWGIDSGPYIPTLWPTEVPVAIRPLLGQFDILTITDQQTRSLTNGTTFDWVVTESVMESYMPLEQAAMYDACQARLKTGVPASKVVHIVNPSFDGTRYLPDAVDLATGLLQPWAGQLMINQGCPVRTLAEWQTSRPNQTFVSFEGIS
jgi:hypothetical protein